MKNWIIEHDDSWWFVGSYLFLAVVLSLFISLFWLVAVVAVHFAFEWVRQSSLDSRPLGVLARSLWEIKLDVAFIVLSLALMLYLDVIMGLAGISGAARLGAHGVRFLGWQRAIRVFFLTVDDVAQVAVRTVTVVRGRDGAQAAAVASTPGPAATVWGPWAGPWGLGDFISLSILLLGLILLLGVPFWTDHSAATALGAALEELRPLP